MIIVVTGVPRSGTSMMMRMLETGGVPCVYEQRADEFNPDGYYECRAGIGGDLSSVPDGHAVKCLHALVGMPPGTDARVIIMRRQLAAAMASVNRMAAARGTDLHRPEFAQGQIDAIRLWCAARPHLEVWYEDVLRNTPNEVLRVARFLGLPAGNRLADMANVVRGRSF